MHKYLVTLRSANPITGPILVTTSTRRTCPTSCSLQGTTCYAERGYLGGFLWTSLDRGRPGDSFGNNIRVMTLSQLLAAIRSLPEEAVWRHNQAGDLMWETGKPDTISRASLQLLVAANEGRRGFAFTHYDPINNPTNAALIAHANSCGFAINLSADTLEHADALYNLGIAPVAVIVDRLDNHLTPKGRKVVICPARTHAAVTCSSCQLCTRRRDCIIGLPNLQRFPLSRATPAL